MLLTSLQPVLAVKTKICFHGVILMENQEDTTLIKKRATTDIDYTLHPCNKTV
jgi:hypothetical protein